MPMFEIFIFLLLLFTKTNSQDIVKTYPLTDINDCYCVIALKDYLFICETDSYSVINITDGLLLKSFERSYRSFILVTAKFFYIRREKNVEMFSIGNWNHIKTLPLEPEYQFFPLLDTHLIYTFNRKVTILDIISDETIRTVDFDGYIRWPMTVYPNNFFFFKSNATDSYLSMFDAFGNLVWNSSLPYCVPIGSSFGQNENADTVTFPTISVFFPFIYVSCPYNNMVNQFNLEGKLINQFGLISPVYQMTSNEEYVFAMMPNRRIWQIKSNTIELVYIYDDKEVENESICYGSMSSSNGFLFYFKCETPLCLKFNIIQKRIVSQSIKTSYTRESIKKIPGSLQITTSDSPSENGINTALYKNLYKNLKTFVNQTSFINPVFHEVNDIPTVMYFAGGGSISKAICGDPFFHQIKLNSFEMNDLTEQPNDFVFETRPLILSSVSMLTLQDYASAIITVGGNAFLIMHGGASCDFSVIESKLVAFDINESSIFTVPTNMILA